MSKTTFNNKWDILWNSVLVLMEYPKKNPRPTCHRERALNSMVLYPMHFAPVVLDNNRNKCKFYYPTIDIKSPIFSFLCSPSYITVCSFVFCFLLSVLRFTASDLQLLIYSLLISSLVSSNFSFLPVRCCEVYLFLKAVMYNGGKNATFQH